MFKVARIGGTARAGDTSMRSAPGATAIMRSPRSLFSLLFPLCIPRSTDRRSFVLLLSCALAKCCVPRSAASRDVNRSAYNPSVHSPSPCALLGECVAVDSHSIASSASRLKLLRCSYVGVRSTLFWAFLNGAAYC